MLTDENSALRMQIMTLTDVNAALVAQRDAAILQNDEARKLLQRFLDAGPEEEYEVILCKLSGDVEAFLSGKTLKPSCEMCKGTRERGGGPCPMCCTKSEGHA